MSYKFIIEIQSDVTLYKIATSASQVERNIFTKSSKSSQVFMNNVLRTTMAHVTRRRIKARIHHMARRTRTQSLRAFHTLHVGTHTYIRRAWCATMTN